MTQTTLYMDRDKPYLFLIPFDNHLDICRRLEPLYHFHKHIPTILSEY